MTGARDRDTAPIGAFAHRHGPGWSAQLALAVGLLLLAGLLLRLPGLNTPPLEQRESQSSIFARGYYLGSGNGLPAWQERVLGEVDTVLKPFEPPLLELAASGYFKAVGDERVWFPRLLSALAWIAGGAFLALLARRITGTVGLLTALVLYLVWPYAAWHSRKFMPDALMVSCLLGAVLLVVRYRERSTRGRLAAAAGAAAVATLIKPGVAFFFVVAVYVGLALSSGSLRSETRSGRLPLFVGAAASLAVLYVAIGRYASGFVNPDATTNRVTPDLIADADFWRGWWDMVSFLLRSPQEQEILALAALALTLVGLAIAPRGIARALLWSLTAGYVVFGLAVASYTATHPYYALPLIPIASLAIGIVVDRVYSALGGRRVLQGFVLGCVVTVAAVGAWKAHALITTPADTQRIADYERIGALTDHTTRAIVVDGNLAHPIMYWGWIVGENWELDYNEVLPPWIDPAEQDFLVVVGNDQLEHAGLRAFTRDREVLVRTERYTVFDLRGT